MSEKKCEGASEEWPAGECLQNGKGQVIEAVLSVVTG